MKRRHLYFLYTTLWALAIWLFYVVQPQGLGPLTILLLYGPPVFILYLVSLFLLDVPGDVIAPALVKTFLQRRWLAIGFFAFGMVILILLLFS